jgi:hypothetical protein
MFTKSNNLNNPIGDEMPEVKSTQAARIVGVSQVTIWTDVKEGRLPAKLVGRRGIISIELDDLRQYAKENRRIFNEKLVQEFVKD